MKIADLYHRVRNGIRYIVSFGRFNPASQSGQQAILHEMQRKAVDASRQIDIPGTGNSQSQSSEARPNQAQFPWSYQPSRERVPDSSGVEPSFPLSASDSSLNPISAPVNYQEPRNDPYYPEYQCKTNDALGCYYPQQTISKTPQAKFCKGCGFPVPLPENREIRGRRGIYQTGTLLGKRGMGRLYRGIQNQEQQSIVIKEFLFPNRCFKNLEDIQQRQATFVRVANLTSADGRDRDFRLIIPWEAIADEQEKRCYLITKTGLDALPTLRTYLANQGAMKGEKIKLLLDQILQTLEFLHGQKFQLASSQMQTGLVHGNLNLDSVLIYESNPQDFFVYLTDLLLWEYLFYRPDIQINPKTINDDLIAVGEIGFEMLAGNSALDPRHEQQWPTVEPALKQFILQLLGLEASFSSATQAREVLRKLPVAQAQEIQKLTAEEDIDAHKRRSWLPWIIAPAAIVALAVVSVIVANTTRKTPHSVPLKVLIPTLEEINIAQGEFTYSLEQKGAASYVLLEPNLLSSRTSLINELQNRKLGLTLQNIWAQDAQQASTQVAQGIANFAIVSQIQPLSSNSVESEIIAYDGVLIVVPFSYNQRDRGLPRALNGKISFEQVRKLYSGKIENWKELGGPDLPVKLYAPAEASAIQLFEEKVLIDPEAIAIFRELMKQGKIYQQETLRTLRTLQYEFENQQIGGISFGFSSQIFGQCGGYPLALQVKSESAFVAFLKRILFLGDDAEQVWIQPNQRTIDPSTNLCKKGSYQLAEELFQTSEYPLSFPLVVLYPRDNRDDEPNTQIGRQFAQMLTTEEGQKLLQETNLVPLQPLK